MTIEDGIYDCKATGAAEYGTSEQGTDQIAVEIQVLDHEGAPLETRNVYLPFTDKAAPYSIDKLRALGFDGASLAKLDGLGSKTARCSVRTEEYQGKLNQKVDVFGERGPAFKKPMTPEAQRGFAARFDRLLSAPKGAPPTKGGASQRGNGRGPGEPPAGRFDDDADIPF